jgi:hypothetical protein
MSELYTPTIFDLFQEQYELFEACIVESMNIQTSSIKYVFAMKKDLGEWQVDYDLKRSQFVALVGNLRALVYFVVIV